MPFNNFFCTVTNFSAVALPIGMKFCLAVWPHLGQVFSHHFGGDSPRDGPILGDKGAVWRDMLFAEALVLCLRPVLMILKSTRKGSHILKYFFARMRQRSSWTAACKFGMSKDQRVLYWMRHNQ